MKALPPLIVALLAMVAPVLIVTSHPAGAKSSAVSAPPEPAGDTVEDTVEDGTAKKKPRKRRASPRKPKDAEPPEPGISAFETECAWIGKRITSLLKRDDVDPARQFEHFYAGFGCPSPHLGKALGCVVATDTEAEPLDDRIDRCWADPYTRQFVAPVTARKSDPEVKPAKANGDGPPKPVESGAGNQKAPDTPKADTPKQSPEKK